MKYDNCILKCPDSAAVYFMPELQNGFSLVSAEGVSVISFLTDYCGISGEYISEKIKTIIIDGGPVDDIFNTKIHHGGVCALSGAMPGILGAMMRMGSPYALMRESITVKPDGGESSGGEILVVLKLFNVILADLGSYFLQKGILLRKERAVSLFEKHGDDIFSSCTEVLFNGNSVHDKYSFMDSVQEDGFIMFRLEMQDESKS